MKPRLLLCTLFFALGLLKAIAQDKPKSVAYFQDERFRAYSNLVGSDSCIYVMGSMIDKENELILFSINPSTLVTRYEPVKLATQLFNPLKRELAFVAISSNEWMLFNSNDKQLFSIKRDGNGVCHLFSVELGEKLEREIKKKPFTHLFANQDSFYLYFSESPMNKRDKFIEVLSVSLKTRAFKISVLVDNVQGSFCSLYKPFKLFALNSRFVVYPDSNLSQLILTDNKSEVRIELGTDTLDRQMYLTSNKLKEKYNLTNRSKYLDDHDSVNALLNRYNGVYLFDDYLLLQYQVRDSVNTVVPDFFYDVYQIVSNDEGLILNSFAMQVKDYSNCYNKTACSYTLELDSVNSFYTNILKSNGNIYFIKDKLILMDMVLQNPTQYSTPQDYMKSTQVKEKVFTLVIYAL